MEADALQVGVDGSVRGVPQAPAEEAGAAGGADGVHGSAPAVTPAALGPEVMLAAASAHASEDEKTVAYELVNNIVFRILPNVYVAAHEIARGWANFRSDFVRCFEAVARPHPLIHGRIDATNFARLAWAIAVDMVGAYAYARGVPRSVQVDGELAAKVIRNWELEYEPPIPLPAPDRAVVKIEDMDGSSVSGDEFIGSSAVKEGTLHELAEEHADEQERNMLHRHIEEIAADFNAEKPNA